MCCSANQAGSTAKQPTRDAPLNPMRPVGSALHTRQKSEGKDEAWRHIPLDNEVFVPSVHPCTLVKFKVAGDTPRLSARAVGKAIDKPPQPAENQDDDEYDDEEFDEDAWQCNGVVYFPSGCRSGQLGFDVHPGVEGWQNPDRENYDMDLCDMCIRWIIHCEKNRLNLSWREPEDEEEAKAQKEQEE